MADLKVIQINKFLQINKYAGRKGLGLKSEGLSVIPHFTTVFSFSGLKYFLLPRIFFSCVLWGFYSCFLF